MIHLERQSEAVSRKEKVDDMTPAVGTNGIPDGDPRHELEDMSSRLSLAADDPAPAISLSVREVLRSPEEFPYCTLVWKLLVRKRKLLSTSIFHGVLQLNPTSLFARLQT
jgi:hypothetical protein